MISVRSLQYTFSRQAYQDLTKVNNGTVNTDVIALMWRDIMFRTDTTPLCGKYRVTAYAPIDLAALNAELSLMQVDTETLSTFLETYLLKLSDMEFVADVWKEYATRSIETTITSLRSFYGNRFIDGITTVISPRASIDEGRSNVTVNADNSISVSPIIAGIPAVSITANNVTITPSATTMTATLTGDAINMFDPSKPSLTMDLDGRKTGKYGFDITVTTDFPHVNMVRIDFGSAQTGLNVAMTIRNGSITTVIFDAVVNAQFVTVPIATAFTGITISLRRDEPSSHTLEGARYEFVVHHISFMQSQIVTDAAFYSKRIDLGADVKTAYLVTKQTSSGNGSAAYYISTSEENGSASSYRLIEPNQTDVPIIFGQETHTHIGKLPAAVTRWPTCSDELLGIRCMNLSKYLAADLVSKVLKVDPVTGIIDVISSSEYEVLYDLIEMHRGYQDYTYSYMPDSNRIDATKLAYRIQVNADTNWVDLVPLQYIESLPITADMIVAATTSATTIRIPYVIVNAETVELKSYTGAVSKPRITSVLNATESCDITIGVALDLRKPYTLSVAVPFAAYLARHKSDCEISTADVTITTDGVVLTPYTDYILHEDSLSVELLKTGVYGERLQTGKVSGSLPGVIISYAFVSTTNIMRKVYETHVFVEKATPITIIPFSATEVASGNFHKCNDVIISYASSYTLARGWNRIQTTQPYPNCQSMHEVNQCTGIFSGAGIIFPSDITTYRAYRNPMRKVPLFMLRIIPRDDVHKCFAVHDRRILIGFQPDQCDATVLLSSLTGSIPDGKKFTARRPRINTKFKNDGYVPTPEQFQVIIPVKKAAVDNLIYLKVVLSQPDNTSAIRIDTIGINTFKE